ncbi:MAG TPA: hypothetical protein VK745_28130 [Polyangiaceae bacterium]|nr:hypothetical protein [Polyangiaceae bacterium]
MTKAHQELSSPQEWLHRLASEQGGYGRLVDESGGMARAAYRLARARCKVESGAPPALDDLQAAARLLAARVGRGGALPITSVLASDADSSGLHATHTALESALRSLPPPPPPSSLRRAASRREEQSTELRSRPSRASH